jgi:hypothetical protein
MSAIPSQINSSPFYISQDQLNDILFGVGAGMSSSESGFVRGFGTAMASAVEAKRKEKERRESREDRLQELMMMDEYRQRSEERADLRQIEAEARASERSKVERGEQMQDRLALMREQINLEEQAADMAEPRMERRRRAELEGRKELMQEEVSLQEQAAERERKRQKEIMGGVRTINGKFIPPPGSDKFKIDFADEFGAVKVGGTPPASWSDNDLFADFLNRADAIGSRRINGY